MDSHIQDDLEKYGYSDVVAILEDVSPLSDPAEDFKEYFLSSIPYITDKVEPLTSDSTISYFPRLGVICGFVNQSGARELEKSSAVKSLQRISDISLIHPTYYDSNNKQLNKFDSWAFTQYEIEKIWAKGYTGKGIKIAHLDTGIDINHASLKSKIKKYVRFSENGTIDLDANMQDTWGHGTHTAGIICGDPIKEFAFGLAPDSNLFVGKIIGSRSKVRLIAGLDWAIQQKVHIINLSMGVRGYTDSFQTIIQRVREAGILIVCAIGNEGPGSSRSPGNYTEVLSVGAIDKYGQMWESSSSNKFNRSNDFIQPDIVAPGVDIVSATPNDQLDIKTGTSQAAPYVTGLAALLWSANLSATDNEIEKAIRSSAKINGLVRERCGDGIINPIKAINNL